REPAKARRGTRPSAPQPDVIRHTSCPRVGRGVVAAQNPTVTRPASAAPTVSRLSPYLQRSRGGKSPDRERRGGPRISGPVCRESRGAEAGTLPCGRAVPSGRGVASVRACGEQKREAIRAACNLFGGGSPPSPCAGPPPGAD